MKRLQGLSQVPMPVSTSIHGTFNYPSRFKIGPLEFYPAKWHEDCYVPPTGWQNVLDI